MKKLYGFYREGRNGYLQYMIDDSYTSKQDFAHDIRLNGYRVINILSEKEIESCINGDIVNSIKEIDVYGIIKESVRWNR